MKVKSLLHRSAEWFDFNSLRSAENTTSTVTISLVLKRKDTGAREKCIHQEASAGKHLRERYVMLDHYIRVTILSLQMGERHNLRYTKDDRIFRLASVCVALVSLT